MKKQNKNKNKRQENLEKEAGIRNSFAVEYNIYSSLFIRVIMRNGTFRLSIELPPSLFVKTSATWGKS